MNRIQLKYMAAAAAVLVSLTACSGGSDGTAATTTSASGERTTAAAGSGAVATTVNANTASQAEIAAVLTAAGVPSASQWAREVTEYRPYSTDDPDFTKLRQNLVKYNPAAGVVDQIVAVLVP